MDLADSCFQQRRAKQKEPVKLFSPPLSAQWQNPVSAQSAAPVPSQAPGILLPQPPEKSWESGYVEERERPRYAAQPVPGKSHEMEVRHRTTRRQPHPEHTDHSMGWPFHVVAQEQGRTRFPPADAPLAAYSLKKLEEETGPGRSH